MNTMVVFVSLCVYTYRNSQRAVAVFSSHMYCSIRNFLTLAHFGMYRNVHMSSNKLLSKIDGKKRRENGDKRILLLRKM